MATILKFVPALSAAIAAFFVIKFFSWLASSLGVEFIVYILTFTVMYFIIELALRRYGNKE